MLQSDAKTTCLAAWNLMLFAVLACLPVLADIPLGQMLAPINLAQETPSVPSLYPTDVTPTPVGRERELLRPGRTYYFYQKLPERFWFNISAETSQRFESNVFQTRYRVRSDYVYRILPTITAGYNLFSRTSVYTNYFVLKDVFADHTRLSFPTTQSLSLGLRHEIPLGQRTVMQFDFQARELWQSVKLRQADLIPGVTLTRTLTPSSVVFGNALLQMRGGNFFVAPTRELDPFYSVGFLHSHGSWVLSIVGTLVTNFRHPTFAYSIPDFSNNSIIADVEISHPVSSKLPGLVAFIRAEPIWNWHDHSFPGISGYDFRLFGGLRYTLSKPAYYASIGKLKQQLKETGKTSNNKRAPVIENPTGGQVPGTPGTQPAIENMTGGQTPGTPGTQPAIENMTGGQTPGTPGTQPAIENMTGGQTPGTPGTQPTIENMTGGQTPGTPGTQPTLENATGGPMSSTTDNQPAQENGARPAAPPNADSLPGITEPRSVVPPPLNQPSNDGIKHGAGNSSQTVFP